MKEFLEKALRQIVTIEKAQEIFERLPLVYRGRYDIYKVETNERAGWSCYVAKRPRNG